MLFRWISARVKSRQKLALPDLRGKHFKKSVTGTVTSGLALEDHEYKSVVISGLAFVGLRRKNTAYGFVGKWP